MSTLTSNVSKSVEPNLPTLKSLNKITAGRFPLSFQVVPSVIMAIGVWFLHESPRWLMERDRQEEARVVLNKLHSTGNNEDFLQLEFEEIRDTIIAEKAAQTVS